MSTFGKSVRPILAVVAVLFAWTPVAFGQSLPEVSTLVENQKASVVYVQTEVERQGIMGLWDSQNPAQLGQGSGFVIDRQGHIITNNHVIQNANKIRVGFENGSVQEAELVGVDPQTDIALLKVKASKDLQPVKLGSSSNLKVGEWVVAIGNPFGLDHSVTAGIISAMGREIGAGPYDNFLQTDASINPGNSGGPLFNMKGEVVGVNTAIIRDGQGIGFSVPIDMVNVIIPQLKQQGYVVRGFIGAGIQPLSPIMAKSFGLKENHGVLISSVEPSGPSQLAGMRPGDIVLNYGKTRVRTPKQLLLAVAQSKPGTSASLRVLRDGKPLSLSLRIAERPDVSRARVVPAKTKPKVQPKGTLGVTVRSIDSRVAQQLGVRPDRGVIVETVATTGPAAGALRRGDIILKIGGSPVNSVAQFQTMAKQVNQSAVRLMIERGGRTTFVAIDATN